MQSFEDLGVTPEIAEALAAEGIEIATPLQEAAIPVVAKGNNLLIEAGPGAGVLLAWGIGLLLRLGPDQERPRAVVLCASREIADLLAESMARLAAATELRIAALGSAWVLPEKAHVVFGTASDVLASLQDGTVQQDTVGAVVVDQANLIEELVGLAGVEKVLEYLPSDTQRVLNALPLTPAVADLANRHFKRTVTVPASEGDAPPRGEVRFRITVEPREAGVLAVVRDVLEEGARHVLLYSRTEDRAADLGDYLTLHGFQAGAPGDPSLPVWLGVDALEGRAAAQGVDGVVVVSGDVPTDSDTLDRRHAITPRGVVVVLTREITHLKRLAKRTGYGTVPFPPPARGEDPMAPLRARLAEAIDGEDTAAYMLALEPLLDRHDPLEIAAAAVALLRRKGGAAPAVASAPTGATRPTGVPSWSKLFISVGERDGLRKGDLLGAITGEAGVPGDAVGRMEVRESHSLVEVHDTVARSVIQRLNGTTIKGRSVRVDFDRPRKGPPRGSRPPQR